MAFGAMSVTFMLTKMALNVCLPAIPSFHYPKENTDSRPHVRTNSGKISDLQFQVLNYKTRNLFRCHSLRYSSFEDSVMYLCLYPSPSRQNLFFFWRNLYLLRTAFYRIQHLRHCLGCLRLHIYTSFTTYLPFAPPLQFHPSGIYSHRSMSPTNCCSSSCSDWNFPMPFSHLHLLIFLFPDTK